MNISILSVQNLQKIFATIAVFAMVFSPFSNVQFARANHDPFGGVIKSSVFFCHSTGNNGGFNTPNSSITATGGQVNIPNGHAGEAHSDDIIPPFHFTGGSYLGQNWNPQTADIWDNGTCTGDGVLPATLTLLKTVINNNGGLATDGQFTLVASGPTTPISGVEGSVNVTNKVVTPGTYTLSETGGPSGYTASQYSCVKNGGSAVVGNSVSIAAGNTVVCTITNTYIPPAYSQSSYYEQGSYYGQSAYYEQSSYYSQSAYAPDYSQSAYYEQSSYYEQGAYYGQSAYYEQSSYYSQSSYTPEYSQSSYYVQSAYQVPKQCLISSDTTTLGNGVASVNTFVHPAWTTTLSTTSADWIWSVDAGQTATFTKTFNVDNAPTGSVLRMAVDNSYVAKLNGSPLTCSGAGIVNFANPIDTCVAPVVSGINTLEVVAQNFGGPNTNDAINPAGLIYELAINGSSCSPVPPPRTHRIEGYKFNDVNGDGVWQEEEPSLSGWTITLFDSPNETSTTTVTGEGGYYSFQVADGSYQVSEVQQVGWEQTATTGNGADGDTCYYNFEGISEGQNLCTFGNHQTSVAQCISKENLLVNGSFEDPIVTEGTWGLFATMTGWMSSSVDGFEIWKGLFGPASAGLQNVELDINTPTAISQKIATVVGNVYKVSFDFAARPERNGADNQMNVLVDGTIVGTVGADGTGDTQKDWVTYSYAFTAASTTTEMKFSDVGTSNGHGTLLDNTAVCLTDDNVVGTYPVFGYVWNDADQDGPTVPEQEVGESSLAGWVVTATDGEQTFSTTTRANGYYLFNLPAGTWTISDGAPAEWNQTYPINTGNTHEVTVPALVTLGDESSLFAQVMEAIVPTAHAQVFLGYGPFNFGNVFAGGSSSNGGGGSSSGSRRKRPTAETPVPQVLGEATSVMPVGAPNTGAGGASHDATLPSLVLALAATRTGLRKAK